MDDQMDPRFAGAVRAALLEEVRSSPRTRSAPARVVPIASRRRRRIEIAVAGVVALAAVAAIVFGALNVARITSAPQPAAPSLPFGGRCTRLLSAAQATELSGTTVRSTVAADPFEDLTAVPVTVAGALRCDWSATGKSAVDAGIVVTVAPAALRGDHRAEHGCSASEERGGVQHGCPVEMVSGGRWITGFLTTPPGTSKAATLAAVQRFTAIVRALPAEPRSAAARTDGWWTQTDCVILADRTRLASAIDAKTFEIDPADSGQQPAGTTAAVDAIGTTACLVQDTADAGFMTVELRAWPGAAGVVGPRVHTRGWTRANDVRGAAVYRRTLTASGVSSPQLVVIDGPNVLLLEAGNGASHAADRMLAAVAPLLRDLDAHKRN